MVFQQFENPDGEQRLNTDRAVKKSMISSQKFQHLKNRGIGSNKYLYQNNGVRSRGSNPKSLTSNIERTSSSEGLCYLYNQDLNDTSFGPKGQIGYLFVGQYFTTLIDSFSSTKAECDACQGTFYPGVSTIAGADFDPSRISLEASQATLSNGQEVIVYTINEDTDYQETVCEVVQYDLRIYKKCVQQDGEAISVLQPGEWLSIVANDGDTESLVNKIPSPSARTQEDNDKELGYIQVDSKKQAWWQLKVDQHPRGMYLNSSDTYLAMYPSPACMSLEHAIIGNRCSQDFHLVPVYLHIDPTLYSENPWEAEEANLDYEEFLDALRLTDGFAQAYNFNNVGEVAEQDFSKVPNRSYGRVKVGGFAGQTIPFVKLVGSSNGSFSTSCPSFYSSQDSNPCDNFQAIGGLYGGCENIFKDNHFANPSGDSRTLTSSQALYYPILPPIKGRPEKFHSFELRLNSVNIAWDKNRFKEGWGTSADNPILGIALGSNNVTFKDAFAIGEGRKELYLNNLVNGYSLSQFGDLRPTVNSYPNADNCGCDCDKLGED